MKDDEDGLLKAGITITVLGLGIAGIVGLHKLIKKGNADSGPGDGGNCNDCQPGNVNIPCISIDECKVGKSEGVFIRLDASYRNLTCEKQTFAIALQVKNNLGVTEKLQFRFMELGSNEAKGFEWNLIFLAEQAGPKNAEFFVWVSENNPIAIAKNKKLNFSVL